MDDQNSQLSRKVPITILTGFLGAGKTTLINYILTASHGIRFAVIQNEFGEAVNLEGAMTIGKNAEKAQEWLELPNGCVCCTVKGELVMTLENLIKKKKPQIDYIVIETTGVADPGPLAASLWLDEALESCLLLDAIITVVDGKNFEKALNVFAPFEAQRQVAFADTILLNKCDLLSPADISRLETLIHRINPFVPIIRTVRSEVSLKQILNLRSFDMNRALTIDSGLVDDLRSHSEENSQHKPSENMQKNEAMSFAHHSSHVVSSPTHTDSVNTVAFEVEGDLELDAVKQWFASVLWDKVNPTMSIFRIKGILSIVGEPMRFLVQGVHENFDIQRSEFAWDESLPQFPANTVLSMF